MDNFPFLELPRELQANILLNEDIQTLGRLCSTNSEIDQLCRDESFWKDKFHRLSNSPPGLPGLPEPTEMGRTWMAQTHLLWKLLHPETVFTIVEHINDENEEGQPIITSLVLGNFKVDTLEHVKQCILEAYHNRVDPLYTSFTTTIANLQGAYQAGDAPDLAQFMDFQLTADDDLKVLFQNSGFVGITYSIYQNYLFKLGPSPRTDNLIVYDGDMYVDVLFTVQGVENWADPVIKVFATLLNFRHLFGVASGGGFNEFYGQNHPLNQDPARPRPLAYVLPLTYVIEQFLGSLARNEFDGTGLLTVERIDHLWTQLKLAYEPVDYGIYIGQVIPCSPLRYQPLAPLTVPLPRPLFPAPPASFFSLQPRLPQTPLAPPPNFERTLE